MHGVFDIQQDVVMLGRPAVLGTAAVVIRPDDHVQKAIPPENGVKQDLTVMHLAVINVEVQAAGRFEQAVSLIKAWFEERQVVVKDIGIAFGADLDGLVAPAAETSTVAVLAAFGADLGARLSPASVEWRVNVDQVDG